MQTLPRSLSASLLLCGACAPRAALRPFAPSCDETGVGCFRLRNERPLLLSERLDVVVARPCGATTSCLVRSRPRRSSTSPLGSTCSQRGCLRPCAKGTTRSPLAGLGAWPFIQGSFATDQLMVGSQLSRGGGSLGFSPYPGGSGSELAGEVSIADKSTIAAPAQLTRCMKPSVWQWERGRRNDVPIKNSASGTNPVSGRWRVELSLKWEDAAKSKLRVSEWAQRTRGIFLNSTERR
jgi:hypothetical protein